jgi:CRP/FNR family transcriptional regulator, cyclic AMP receptor protein
MDELDFTAPATARPAYDAAAAQAFFALQGREEQAAAGETIFTEDEKSSRLLLKRDKIYLLLEGEVELSVGKQAIDTVKPGGIFGELALITRTARSATAKARTECRFIALDDKQLLSSLREKPEFALVLMHVIVDRLRATIGRVSAANNLPKEEEMRESGALGKELLAELTSSRSGEATRLRYAAGRTVVEQGQAGMRMYVVLEGEVSIRIQESVVEKVGPGGIFGEMALVGGEQRLASAVTESDCELLGINRNVFIDLVKSNPGFGVAVLNTVSERARYMASRRAGD